MRVDDRLLVYLDAFFYSLVCPRIRLRKYLAIITLSKLSFVCTKLTSMLIVANLLDRKKKV